MNLVMSVKDDSISMAGLQPQIVLALMVAKSVYDLYETPLVITSLNDAHHSYTSLHYSGNAVDIRTYNLPVGLDPHQVAGKIDDALGQDFDVLFEKDHIHIEYQPRRRG